MKIEHQHIVSYLEVNPNFNITIKNLIKNLQASAVTHSKNNK